MGKVRQFRHTLQAEREASAPLQYSYEHSEFSIRRVRATKDKKKTHAQHHDGRMIEQYHCRALYTYHSLTVFLCKVMHPVATTSRIHAARAHFQAAESPCTHRACYSVRSGQYLVWYTREIMHIPSGLLW